ncbi:MAG: TerC/Alx family metal homeostasis membrane protein [Phycisphaerales bacterium]|nr:TerC/Alx family metal homeostasis membrane protein [Phycisphaerales bacterium]
MTLIYITFLSLLGVLLALDLLFLNRGAHAIGVAKALRQTAMWFCVAVAFNVGVFLLYDNHVAGLGGPAPAPIAPGQPPVAAAAVDPHPHDALLPENGREAAVMFFQGYLLEFMLSLDNMMVIAMIMTFFRVPAQFQHRVLFWGIIGAVILRGLLIAAGAALVSRFDWILYVFGAFLVYSSIKLLRAGEEEAPDLDQNVVVRAARRLLNVTKDYHGSNFFVRINGTLAATPMLLVLLCVEFADVIFAVDSIPAIFGTTLDPFLVLTSNCFAILGLRSLYFAVAALTSKFRYLKYSMIAILAFIGVKMLLPILDEFEATRAIGLPTHLSPYASLATIAVLMLVGLVASFTSGSQEQANAQPAAADTDSADAPGATHPARAHELKPDAARTEPDSPAARQTNG